MTAAAAVVMVRRRYLWGNRTGAGDWRRCWLEIMRCANDKLLLSPDVPYGTYGSFSSSSTTWDQEHGCSRDCRSEAPDGCRYQLRMVTQLATTAIRRSTTTISATTMFLVPGCAATSEGSIRPIWNVRGQQELTVGTPLKLRPESTSVTSTSPVAPAVSRSKKENTTNIHTPWSHFSRISNRMDGN